jgi:Trypsin-like peptidase domain
MHRLRRWTLGGLILGACADAGPEPLELRAQAVVYGENDRRDLYQLPPAAPLRSLARSVAAVIPREAVGQGPAGEPILLGQTLAQAFGLCADQPYAQEISAAVCTAFLVDDALLATAGHCFDYALDCQKYFFVFDYVRASAATDLPLSAENMFECTRSRVHVDEAEPGVWKRDYAIVELTRRALGRAPLSVRSQPIKLAEPVSVISASAGLALKFDQGARVLDARAHMGDFFRLDSDTAHGSSGAPVFDEDGQAVGIVTRGRTDYLLDPEAGCFVDNVLPPPELVPPGERVKFPGPGELYSEEANPIAPALAALCELSYPSPRLCDNAALCGDQICSGEETFEVCPSDCSEAPPPSPRPPAVTAEADAGVALPEASTAPPEHARAHASCALRSAGSGAPGAAWLLALSWVMRMLRARSRARSARASV